MALFLLANFPATLYFVFYLWVGLRPQYRYGTKYNVARKLAKRNGAIIYAKIGVPDPRVPRLPLLQVLRPAWCVHRVSESVSAVLLVLPEDTRPLESQA